jgi:uncharacterized protein YndB with AHSA1/START domain
MTNLSDTTPQADRELILTRVFDAPRERVFKAWTDPAQVPRFWGPHGMTTPVCEIDLKPGGVFRTVMRAPDGTEYPNQGVYLEIVAPERLVFTDAFTDAWVPSAKPFMTCVMTFEEQDGRTKLTARALHGSAADREAHEKMGFYRGWGESLDRLEAHLATLRPEGSGGKPR